MELDQQGLTTSDYFWMDKLADVVSGSSLFFFHIHDCFDRMKGAVAK